MTPHDQQPDLDNANNLAQPEADVDPLTSGQMRAEFDVM